MHTSPRRMGRGEVHSADVTEKALHDDEVWLIAGDGGVIRKNATQPDGFTRLQA